MKVEYAGLHELRLELVAGRWLISSEVRLFAVPDCRPGSAGRCQPGVRHLALLIGASIPGSPEEAMLVPPAVERAGRRVLREFEVGATVTAQSGCLACHRIGGLGNRDPGGDLTHVGDRLAPPQIEHAIFDPKEPMPSFKNLPPRKLHALVRFLSLLC